MNRHWLPLLLVPTMLLLFAGLGAAVPRGTALQPPPTCQQLQFHVALAPGAPARYKVVGWLCTKPPLTGRTVQVLIPGSTLNHLYWDFPLRPQQYSYVRALTNAGYATLNLDRLGSGQSDLPPGDRVTVQAQAYVVHQIVQALHAGQRPASSFGKVILVGHSMGAAIAVVEANRYADVDGVILTGFLHTDAPTASVIAPLFYSAARNRKFAHRRLPPGYSTTLPGTRVLFMYSSNTDPHVLAVLEKEGKDISPDGEDFRVAVGPPPSYGPSACRFSPSSGSMMSSIVARRPVPPHGPSLFSMAVTARAQVPATWSRRSVLPGRSWSWWSFPMLGIM